MKAHVVSSAEAGGGTERQSSVWKVGGLQVEVHATMVFPGKRGGLRSTGAD